MIDTIIIYINRKHLNNNTIPFDLIKEKMIDKSVKKIYGNDDKLIGITGMINNFHVNLTYEYMRINGSLCKFLKGNNTETLTRSEIKQALKKLSTLLDVPIARGYLRRVDAGRNFIMENDAIDYFGVLKETPKYRRNIGISELKYMRGDYTLAFYDKGKEIADKNETFGRRSYSLRNKSYLLRYELKIEKNVAARLKYNNTKAVLLFSPSFLDKLNEKWYEHYNKLIKEKRIAFDEKVNGVKELRNQLEIAGIDNFGGEAKVKTYIDDLRKKNNWTYKQVHDAKKMIDKIMNNPALYCDDAKATELNKAIEKAYWVDNRSEVPHQGK